MLVNYLIGLHLFDYFYFILTRTTHLTMNHSNLSSTELELFQKIHYETIYNKKRKGRFNRKEFWEQPPKRAHKDKTIYAKIDIIKIF